MAVEMIEIEMLVLVDSSGNWEIGRDDDDLKERWEANVGDLIPEAMRMVKVKVKVPQPKLVEIEATVADEPGEVEMKVK